MSSTAHLTYTIAPYGKHIANLLNVSKLSIDVYLYKRGCRLRNGMKQRSPRKCMGIIIIWATAGLSATIFPLPIVIGKDIRFYPCRS